MRCDYSCNGCDSERKLPAPRGFGEHTIEPNVRGQFEKRIEFHTITEGHADECQHHEWRDRQTNQWRNDKTFFWHAPRFQKVQKCISHQPDKKGIRKEKAARRQFDSIYYPLLEYRSQKIFGAVTYYPYGKKIVHYAVAETG